MTRSDVLDAWEAFLKGKLTEQEASLDDAESTARDAPGSNVTRSDQSREQYSNLALGLQQVIAATKDALGFVQKIRLQPRTTNIIRPGSLVRTSSPNSAVSFLVIPFAQGDKLTIGHEEILVISPESPIGAQLIGKEVGDELRYKSEELDIDEIL
ncbi:MAG: hypothetical protein V4681_02700 [Patescibacteria group bacterium]